MPELPPTPRPRFAHRGRVVAAVASALMATAGATFAAAPAAQAAFACDADPSGPGCLGDGPSEGGAGTPIGGGSPGGGGHFSGSNLALLEYMDPPAGKFYDEWVHKDFSALGPADLRTLKAAAGYKTCFLTADWTYALCGY